MIIYMNHIIQVDHIITKNIITLVLIQLSFIYKEEEQDGGRLGFAMGGYALVVRWSRE
jgi:hypothetical protein